MKTFKKPDLNAPRFRPKRHNILNNDFCKKFRSENPRFAHLSNEQIKTIVKASNGKLWTTVIQQRDGVEFPEQLGYLFIGSCPRKKGENTDYNRSLQYGVKIQHRNYESDQYTAKIFYTNYETKYRFRFHELWGFTGVRDFTRGVAQAYPTEWKKYVVVDNLTKVSRLFRKERFKEFKKKVIALSLEHYDEFDLD